MADEQNTISENELNNSNELMIGELVAPSTLLEAYQNNPLPGFIPGINHLTKKYSSMRRVRGDGNCFYRSFLFSYLENLFNQYQINPELATIELNRFQNIIENSSKQLIDKGYEEFTFEYFYDLLVSLLNELFTLNSTTLLEKFQADGESDYYTWYMRLLTSLSLKNNADNYLPFILDSGCNDIDSFCRKEVEPMGRECEQMQIIAIAEYFRITIDIEYLDGQLFDESNGLSVVKCRHETIDELSSPNVTLLYRPGHYDILYL